MRLLFASIYGYLDPASGAALCMRDLLELIEARGMDCRVLAAGVLDAERDTSLDQVFATQELPASSSGGERGAVEHGKRLHNRVRRGHPCRPRAAEPSRPSDHRVLPRPAHRGLDLGEPSDFRMAGSGGRGHS